MALTSTVNTGYLGELFQIGEHPNTLLRFLGGLRGQVRETSARTFPTGVFYTLANPSAPARLEGAAAPTAISTTLTQSTNAIQIFTESVAVSYLGMSDKTVGGVVPIPQSAAQGKFIDPRSTDFQVMKALEKIGRDANYSFYNGVYSNPGDPTSTALATRGILTAITTNLIDNSTDSSVTAAMYKAYVESAVKAIVSHTGYMTEDSFLIVAGVNEYNNIQAAYESKTTPPYDRFVAGLHIKQIYTRMGILNLALDPDVPADQFAVLDLRVAGIVGMPVEGKGLLFEEPLAKTGSFEGTQIYGQLGIDHGPEFHHALVKVADGISL